MRRDDAAARRCGVSRQRPARRGSRRGRAGRRSACRDAGADLMLTGPWPAYNFVQQRRVKRSRVTLSTFPTRLPAAAAPRRPSPPRACDQRDRQASVPARRRAAPIVRCSETSLLDVVDSLLNKGVVLNADVILALANVDLVYLRLSALLCAADRVFERGERRRRRSVTSDALYVYALLGSALRLPRIAGHRRIDRVDRLFAAVERRRAAGGHRSGPARSASHRRPAERCARRDPAGSLRRADRAARARAHRPAAALDVGAALRRCDGQTADDRPVSTAFAADVQSARRRDDRHGLPACARARRAGRC